VRIYTLGTADRSEAEIAKILSKYQVQVLADIRRSTVSPLKHLIRENIQKLCKNNRVEYIYLGNELGSDRETGRPHELDPDLYQRGLSILRGIARTRGLLILCHEKDPANCNRRFIAEELAKEGAEVCHLLELEELWSPSRREPKSRKHQVKGKERKGRKRMQARKKSPGKRPPPLKKKTSRSKMDKVM
jgi:uncharacterized protein (DUF488 family)